MKTPDGPIIRYLNIRFNSITAFFYRRLIDNFHPLGGGFSMGFRDIKNPSVFSTYLESFQKDFIQAMILQISINPSYEIWHRFYEIIHY